MNKEDLLLVVVRKVNVVRPVCNHMVGRHHTFIHRAIVGVGVMVTGVLIAKGFGHDENFYIQVAGDAVGYGLHGLGLTPFVEALLESVAEDIA